MTAAANPASKLLSMSLPRTLAFGAGCARRCAEDIANLGLGRIFVITGSSTRAAGESLAALVQPQGSNCTIFDKIQPEPTIQTFETVVSAARDARADAVIGLGGGSAMDVAKLVASFLKSNQPIRETFGIGKLNPRSTPLICLPTTSGTGSEVSPNAILLDESDQLKKGVISPHLMPDAAYVDPMLTLTVPPPVTAATGIDALTHCIEAYANLLAHPMIDLYALQGIRLISRSIVRAVEHGGDIDARTDLALGSMYGGMCLGPVNTGAVHALAYPLGGEFHVAHGVSNALLLPHVLEFNLPAAPDRYAQIARALGCGNGRDDMEMACAGLKRIRELVKQVGIPARLRDFGIPETAIERMAKSAMTVTRLLDRNVRQVTLNDAINIYRRAF